MVEEKHGVHSTCIPVTHKTSGSGWILSRRRGYLRKIGQIEKWKHHREKSEFIEFCVRLALGNAIF